MFLACLSVILSVCCPKLKEILKFVITFAILKIATWYLACMCISWSCTFWVVKGQGYPSRSKVFVFMSPSLYWGTYCFCPVCLFVGLFVCWFAQTLTLAITFAILKIATWYLAYMCISWSCTFWVVKGQGHPSRWKVIFSSFFFFFLFKTAPTAKRRHPLCDALVCL